MHQIKQQEMMMERERTDLYTPSDIILHSRAKPPHDNLCIIAEKKADQSLVQKARIEGGFNHRD